MESTMCHLSEIKVDILGWSFKKKNASATSSKFKRIDFDNSFFYDDEELL